DGSAVKEWSARQDVPHDTNQPIVSLELTRANNFGEITRGLATPEKQRAGEKLLIIWMNYQEGDSFEEEISKDDPKFISASSVSERLNTSDVMIDGDFTVDSAQYLADILNAGSLPVNMTELYSTSVGAQFGEQALNQTVFAGIVGVAIIFIFMIAFYRLPGLIAAINLAIYI